MEAVKTFNSELYSLNDYKPPISKAKMTQITKAAIKAIKMMANRRKMSTQQLKTFFFKLVRVIMKDVFKETTLF